MAIGALEAIDNVGVGAVNHILSMGIGYDACWRGSTPGWSLRTPSSCETRSAAGSHLTDSSSCKGLVRVEGLRKPDESEETPGWKRAESGRKLGAMVELKITTSAR